MRVLDDSTVTQLATALSLKSHIRNSMTLLPLPTSLDYPNPPQNCNHFLFPHVVSQRNSVLLVIAEHG